MAWLGSPWAGRGKGSRSARSSAPPRPAHTRTHSPSPPSCPRSTDTTQTSDHSGSSGVPPSTIVSVQDTCLSLSRGGQSHLLLDLLDPVAIGTRQCEAEHFGDGTRHLVTLGDLQPSLSHRRGSDESSLQLGAALGVVTNTNKSPRSRMPRLECRQQLRQKFTRLVDVVSCARSAEWLNPAPLLG